MKTLVFTILLTISSLSSFASQEKKKITSSDYQNNQIEMADNFRKEGKIYVVIAVILSIFASTTFYLIRQEKRMNRLESEVDDFINSRNRA